MIAAAAVVFDFYGTLTPGRTASDQHRVRAEQAAALGVDPQRFDAELTATIDDALPRRRRQSRGIPAVGGEAARRAIPLPTS